MWQDATKRNRRNALACNKGMDLQICNIKWDLELSHGPAFVQVMQAAKSHKAHLSTPKIMTVPAESKIILDRYQTLTALVSF